MEQLVGLIARKCDAVELNEARCGRLHEGGELAVEAGVVGVDVDDAPAEGAHGQLGGIHDGVTGRIGTQRSGLSGEGVDGDTTEAFPQLIGCGEAEVADLVEALDAHVASRAVGDEQRPDRLDVAIGGLRHARSAA